MMVKHEYIDTIMGYDQQFIGTIEIILCFAIHGILQEAL